MCADHRKNGRLQKYHYSKIHNAGDCVARTGVRDIGFKSGSLPHNPGGITCIWDASSWVLTSTEQSIMCLSQGHNAVPPVRLEPTTPRPRVKHYH